MHVCGCKFILHPSSFIPAFCLLPGLLMPPFNFWIFALLVFIFMVSVGMFWAHIQRWTRNHWWFGLREWAGNHGYALHGERRASVPVPLAGLTLPPPVATVALARGRTVFLQINTPAQAITQAESGREGIGEPVTARPRQWNVLVREIEGNWPATALRPAIAETSLVDVFELASFPALLASDRLSVHGLDAKAARALAKSMVTALLPKDLGLILHGRRMVIDFSGRVFDSIELTRILALADQLAAHLPVKH